MYFFYFTTVCEVTEVVVRNSGLLQPFNMALTLNGDITARWINNVTLTRDVQIDSITPPRDLIIQINLTFGYG